MKDTQTKMVTRNQENKALQLLLADPLENSVVLPDQRLHFIHDHDNMEMGHFQ
jgi:hypothetical protein